MIYLNIGSNLPLSIEDRKNNIEKAVKHLKDLTLKLIKISSFYETPSYPNKSDPRFINLCIKLETNLKPLMLQVTRAKQSIKRLKKYDYNPFLIPEKPDVFTLRLMLA